MTREFSPKAEMIIAASRFCLAPEREENAARLEAALAGARQARVETALGMREVMGCADLCLRSTKAERPTALWRLEQALRARREAEGLACAAGAPRRLWYQDGSSA